MTTSLAAALLESDRVFVQAVLALLVAFTLGILVQGRLFDPGMDSPMPERVQRRWIVVELVAVAFVLVIAAIGAYICGYYLSEDEPLSDDERRLIEVAVAFVVAYAVVHSLLRRAIPYMWRRHHLTGRSHFDERLVFTIFLAVEAALLFGLPAMYVATDSFTRGLLLLAVAAAFVMAAVAMLGSSGFEPRSRRRYEDKILNAGYRRVTLHVPDDVVVQGWALPTRDDVVFLETNMVRAIAGAFERQRRTLVIPPLRKYVEIRDQPTGSIQARCRIHQGQLGLYAVPLRFGFSERIEDGSPQSGDRRAGDPVAGADDAVDR